MNTKKFPDGGCQITMKKNVAELNPEKYIEMYNNMPEQTSFDKRKKNFEKKLFDEINGNKEELIKKANERKAEQARIAKEAEEKAEKERQDAMKKTATEKCLNKVKDLKKDGVNYDKQKNSYGDIAYLEQHMKSINDRATMQVETGNGDDTILSINEN